MRQDDRERFFRLYQNYADSINKTVAEIDILTLRSEFKPECWLTAIKALQLLVCNPGAYPRVPSIVDLWKKLKMDIPFEFLNTEDIDLLIRKIALRISTATSSLGIVRGDEAQVMIGPLGWKAIKMNGGWGEFCHAHLSSVESLIKKARISMKEMMDDGIMDIPYTDQERDEILKITDGEKVEEKKATGQVLKMVRDEVR